MDTLKIAKEVFATEAKAIEDLALIWMKIFLKP